MKRFAIALLGVAFTSSAFLFLSGCSRESTPNPQQADAAHAQQKTHVQEHDGPEHGGHEADHKQGDESASAEISQKICPVMGNPIDPEVSIEHKGRKVYFCCKPCIEKFEKEPAKYLAKLESR